MLGDRPCVRQSRLGRQHDGGNAMKEILGHSDLMWDTDRTQGAYTGGRAAGPGTDRTPQQRLGGGQGGSPAQRPSQQQPQQQEPEHNAFPQGPAQQSRGHRRGAGEANKTTYNVLTGQ